jgi:deoxyribodipyrimidine photo-lyase
MKNNFQPPVIMWFRRDLRLCDNAALIHSSNSPIIPLFILDDKDPGNSGSASNWWLHKSLISLQKSLNKYGLNLVLRRGDPLKILKEIVESHKVSGLYWNRCYEPYTRDRDKKIKEFFTPYIECKSFNASLLAEPWTLKTQAGTPYQVFTPYWKALKGLGNFGNPLPPPLTIKGFPGPIVSDVLERWGLHPTHPDWSQEFKEVWTPGEDGANKSFSFFLENLIHTYGKERNLPHYAGTSKLSPHLRWGEISPRQIWHSILTSSLGEPCEDTWIFLSEIAWREFSYYLLYYFPELPTKPLRKSFQAFPWVKDEIALHAWQKGMTGYPIIDAGMRQLWHTGWMHNRVRMLVASFLVKDLLIPWQEGASWFYDTLVDADLASNSASWQWVAGCGVDASPYFRIFNPVLQGKTFDSQGKYIRRWVPELISLPDKYIHTPWEAPLNILESAGIRLGHTYPFPIVDHKKAREQALDAFKAIKSLGTVTLKRS